MRHNNWLETKRECEVDLDGNQVIKKVTLELQRRQILGFDRKDFYDLIIRIIGLAAIFTPIFFFYLARNAEIKKQKTLLQFDIYSSTSKVINTLLNNDIESDEFKKSKDILFYDLSPKISLLYDREISKNLDSIKTLIDHSYKVYTELGRLDSLIFLGNRFRRKILYTDTLNINVDEDSALLKLASRSSGYMSPFIGNMSDNSFNKINFTKDSALRALREYTSDVFYLIHFYSTKEKHLLTDLGFKGATESIQYNNLYVFIVVRQNYELERKEIHKNLILKLNNQDTLMRKSNQILLN